MIESQMRRTSVLVAHELPIVAAGLAAILREHPEFNVLIHDESRERSAGLPLHLLVDVVVTGHDGAIRWMKDGNPVRGAVQAEGPRILLVAASDREADVRAALDAGVHGYVLMGCELAELVGCVGLLHRGLRYLCPSAARRVAESLTHQCLTSRESDVLQLMVKGCSNKVIARQLDIALGTVKAHVKAVLGKLGVSTRLQAVAAAAERGLGVSSESSPSRTQPNVVTFPSFPPDRAAAKRSGALPDVSAHPLRAWSAAPVDRRTQALTTAAYP